MWLAASADRRVSVWAADWLKDKCDLLDWLTFPAPAYFEVPSIFYSVMTRNVTPNEELYIPYTHLTQIHLSHRYSASLLLSKDLLAYFRKV